MLFFFNFEFIFEHTIKDKETRMLIALELQNGQPVLTSEDAILSMYNKQKAEIESYQQKLESLQSNEHYLKKTIQGLLLEQFLLV